MTEPGQLRLAVDETIAGKRLDAALADAFPAISRSRWQKRIEQGAVRIDQQVVTRAKQKVLLGQVVDATLEPPTPSAVVAQDIPLDVLFEDEHLIVLNKPAGLVVHPAPGHPTGTLVNALLFHAPGMSIADHERPGIVHRLDKDTSGVMVVAKTDAAHAGLSAQFKDRTVDKRYRAYCLGTLRESPLHLVTGHARHPHDRKRFSTKMAAPDEGDTGPVRRAEARYTTVAVRDGFSALDVALGTGRTHQIRAQLADVGHALIGDALYGGQKLSGRFAPSAMLRLAERMERQALHAAALSFDHPHTGERLTHRAPLPDDLRALDEALVGPQK